MGRNVGYLNASRTSGADECYTPFYAVEPLLEFLPKDKVIWCPFDEEWSAFYRLFSKHGYNVIRSSLAEGQDFFTYEPKRWDILISNPPFSKKDDVIKRAYSFGKPFALLLPLACIQSKRRFGIWGNNIQMLCFDGRICYHTRGNMKDFSSSVHFGSAYFCRDFLPTKLEMRKLVRYSRPLVEDAEVK